MSTLDKTIRLIVAALVGIGVFTGVITGIWTYLLIALAVIFIATSFIGTCPLYMPFKFSTCKKEN